MLIENLKKILRNFWWNNLLNSWSCPKTKSWRKSWGIHWKNHLMSFERTFLINLWQNLWRNSECHGRISRVISNVIPKNRINLSIYLEIYTKVLLWREDLKIGMCARFLTRFVRSLCFPSGCQQGRNSQANC